MHCRTQSARCKYLRSGSYRLGHSAAPDTCYRGCSYSRCPRKYYSASTLDSTRCSQLQGWAKVSNGWLQERYHRTRSSCTFTWGSRGCPIHQGTLSVAASATTSQESLPCSGCALEISYHISFWLSPNATCSSSTASRYQYQVNRFDSHGDRSKCYATGDPRDQPASVYETAACSCRGASASSERAGPRCLLPSRSARLSYSQRPYLFWLDSRTELFECPHPSSSRSLAPPPLRANPCYSMTPTTSYCSFQGPYS